MNRLITILFLFGGVAQGQTRLYVSTAAPIFTVTQNANWFRNPAIYPNDIFKLSSGYILSPSLASPGYPSYNDSTTFPTPHRMLCMQYVTLPLGPQTIASGSTVQMQFRLNRSSGLLTGFGFVAIRLINANGSIAQEIDTLNSSVLQSSTQTNTSFSYTFKTNINVQAGQMFCFEQGARIDKNTGNGTSYKWTANYVVNNANGDLPVDNTTQNTANTWIEFSQKLKWQYTSNHFF